MWSHQKFAMLKVLRSFSNNTIPFWPWSAKYFSFKYPCKVLHIKSLKNVNVCAYISVVWHAAFRLGVA